MVVTADCGHLGCDAIQSSSEYQCFHEHTASRFRVKMSMIIMQLGYIGSLHGRWSLRSVQVGEKTTLAEASKEQ
jgi:hypothetical protein